MKYLTPQELKEGGYLQEVNRQFFHPLGLALAVDTDDELDDENYFRVQVWDDREDPEGWLFGDLTDPESQKHATKVRSEAHAKNLVRLNALNEIGAKYDNSFMPVVQPTNTQFNPFNP